VGCLAPYGAEGLESMAGMGEENRAAFGAALTGEDELRTLLENVGHSFASVTADEVAASLGNLVSSVDRLAVTGEAAAWLADVFRESVRDGIWGWVDDELALVGPWGFGLEDIGVPVSIWQGSQDRMTPFAHGEWLVANIPGARPHLLADHGHLSMGIDSFGWILDDLFTIAPA
jgi:pimeloyl-ACP methyl ester carboxylesterase